MNTGFGLLPPWLRELRAVALALLSEDGQIIEANEGFLATLAGLTEGTPTAGFIEPGFSLLAASPAQGDGLVYQGLIRLGAPEGPQRAFAGRVYRVNTLLFLVAEMDISAFEATNAELAQTKKELDEVRRVLTRRSHALQQALEEIAQLKRLDTVTGLANRAVLDQRMEDEIRRWERSRRPLALLLMDIDNFTAINENYSREVGDEILGHIATLLKQAVRGVDLAVRYGGQEFALLLPETNEMGAIIVAERIRMELESQLILPVLEPVTASFGAATYIGGESRAEFYARAWRALKHSKSHGKNCVTMAGVVPECDHLYQGDSAVKQRSEA